MKKIFLLGLLSVSLAFAGCSGESGEEDHFIVSREEAAITYKMAPVLKGDVLKTSKMYVTYKQLREENLSFPVSAKQVSKVYVNEGDAVKAGDLLAELAGGSLESRIEELRYRISRNEISLKAAKSNRDCELNAAKINYEAGEKSDADTEWYNQNKKNITKNYSYTIQDLEDSLEIDRLQLSIFEEDLADSRLTAGMDGTVSFVKKNLKGSTSVIDETVITVIDDSECLFTLTGNSYAKYFKENESVPLSISVGTAAGEYSLYPYNMSSWDTDCTFALADTEEKPIITVGTSGSIIVPTDIAKDVLFVPTSAVHTADEKSYVYVLTDENVRAVRWVSTGLFGNDFVEIKEGLSEGEMVVIK